MIFSITHKRVRGPIHIVHSENWLVYSYFNEKGRRTEIATLELYEGKIQSNTTGENHFQYTFVSQKKKVLIISIGSVTILTLRSKEIVVFSRITSYKISYKDIVDIVLFPT